MGVVVSFQGYTPSVRFDEVPWTDAQVEEAPAETGPWSLIDTLPLDPLDEDPADPAARNLTTENGTANDLWYRLIFVDATAGTSEPTRPIQNAERQPGSHDYITLEQLKSTLTLEDDFADDDLLRSITAASRAVDDICERRFYADPDDAQLRYYSPRSWSGFEIDDLIELTALDTDPKGDGSFERHWTLDTDFALEPLNAAADFRPYERVTLIHPIGWQLPTWTRRSVRITGRFGWAEVPAEVETATTIIASQSKIYQRQAPLGIQVIGGGLDAGSAVRVARNDPFVMRLLSRVTRSQALIR